MCLLKPRQNNSALLSARGAGEQTLFCLPCLPANLRGAWTAYRARATRFEVGLDAVRILQKTEDTKNHRSAVKKCPKANEPVNLLKTKIIRKT